MKTRRRKERSALCSDALLGLVRGSLLLHRRGFLRGQIDLGGAGQLGGFLELRQHLKALTSQRTISASTCFFSARNVGAQPGSCAAMLLELSMMSASRRTGDDAGDDRRYGGSDPAEMAKHGYGEPPNRRAGLRIASVPHRLGEQD